VPTAATQETTLTDRSAERTCLLCSCTLAPDNQGRLCAPCERARRDYDPAHDQSFGAILRELFLLHPGEEVHPLTDLGISPTYRWSVVTWVRRLRRHMAIDGVRGKGGGYVYRPDKVVTIKRRCRGKRRE
jgi:hypothetical protein